MKHIFHFIFSLFICSAVFISCSRSSEYYAKKEHGLKFDYWELCYRSIDHDVYRPYLRLAEPVVGTLVSAKAEYDSHFRLHRDTTLCAATLIAFIETAKSSENAEYYNTIYFKLKDESKYGHYGVDYSFTVSNGKSEPVTFITNESHEFRTKREDAERIIQMLYQDDNVNFNIKFKSDVGFGVINGSYEFNVPGSRKLEDAIRHCNKREIQAREEYKKIKI